jgi:hypothetical protein
MKKIYKFGLTFITELIPLVGAIVPAWTIYVFTELQKEGQLTAPEGLIMFPTALIIDIVGFICIFLALDDWGIVDIIGTVIIGGWALVRGQIKQTLE